MDQISIQGARVHNLKNIDINIPRNKLVVITGLSGSGKSSLAFDTIYAEGQRRYVESLSSYARQFLHLQNKPNVESISGFTVWSNCISLSTLNTRPLSQCPAVFKTVLNAMSFYSANGSTLHSSLSNTINISS